MDVTQLRESVRKFKRLIHIGVELSAQRDHQSLLEEILLSAKDLTGADGGTLYVVTPDRALRFGILRTDSLRLHLGGASGNPVSFPDIPLYTIEGEESVRTVVGYAAHRQSTVNIDDAYAVQGFDFSGTRDFDARTGYRTKSVLTVPLRNHVGTVIGVLQILNATNRQGEVVPFSIQDQELVEALASHAAMAMSNQRLISSLNEMLEGFIQAIAKAIDEKSEHTGDHCRRVPVIARMLAEAVNAMEQGPYAQFRFTDEELYELDIAALLHDCGKVSTPTHLIDKGKRLEALVNRMDFIQQRSELLYKDFQLAEQRGDMSRREFQAQVKALHDDLAFLTECNEPRQVMTADKCARVRKIAQRQWTDHKGEFLAFLSADEISNLCIPTGTLNTEERKQMERHAETSISLLNTLSYPEHLQHVPEIAGGHHERLNGGGYPRGLVGKDISLRARILAIADVFEALTSPNRPYKEPIPLSRAMQILEELCDERHLDSDLYDVFLRQGVHNRFAQNHLDPLQVDL